MMKFDEALAEIGVWNATNALKPVSIQRTFRGTYNLSMPHGDLERVRPICVTGLSTFDRAKRYAETYVGFSFDLDEYIAA